MDSRAPERTSTLTPVAARARGEPHASTLAYVARPAPSSRSSRYASARTRPEERSQQQNRHAVSCRAPAAPPATVSLSGLSHPGDPPKKVFPERETPRGCARRRERRRARDKPARTRPREGCGAKRPHCALPSVVETIPATFHSISSREQGGGARRTPCGALRLQPVYRGAAPLLSSRPPCPSLSGTRATSSGFLTGRARARPRPRP